MSPPPPPSGPRHSTHSSDTVCLSCSLGALVPHLLFQLAQPFLDGVHHVLLLLPEPLLRQPVLFLDLGDLAGAAS